MWYSFDSPLASMIGSDKDRLPIPFRLKVRSAARRVASASHQGPSSPSPPGFCAPNVKSDDPIQWISPRIVGPPRDDIHTPSRALQNLYIAATERIDDPRYSRWVPIADAPIMHSTVRLIIINGVILAILLAGAELVLALIEGDSIYTQAKDTRYVRLREHPPNTERRVSPSDQYVATCSC